MSSRGYDCFLISDFNVEILSGYLTNSEEIPAVRATCGAFGQVVPNLLESSAQDGTGADVAVIWTRPEAVIESFHLVLASDAPPLDKLLQEVREFAAAIAECAQRFQAVFVPTWAITGGQRGLGMSDLRPSGLEFTVIEMNRVLRELLSSQVNVYFLNTERWLRVAGRAAFDPLFWYTAKVPFGRNVLREAALDIKSALAGISGCARKLVVVDLDDTLWGGTVGDDGWENLRVGGHDPIGEAFSDFQRALKALTQQGVILGIVSKNDESIALEAMREHPEMVLQEDDFAGWRINWNDKAANLVELVEELNLGLDSVVFIDDNPAERGRITEAFSEVLVPDWPQDRMKYVQALQSLRCFEAPSITLEDRERTRSYATERERRTALASVDSIQEWQRTLQIQVVIEELDQSNIKRGVQLLNKTNQMNLTTRRLSENELLQWVASNDRKVWCFRVTDRFGDSGVTGLTSVSLLDTHAIIQDFVLSCRVFGRGIEHVMANTAVSYARQRGAEIVEARLLPTKKNRPCEQFLQSSDFEKVNGEDAYHWRCNNKYLVPDYIQVTLRPTA